jgi:menaquinone-dependent protoporphyrinogen oxidase
MKMENKILVAYATKYGSTKEIAEKIGDIFKQESLQADVLPVKSVKNLAGYKNVVLGVAMYMGMWRKEAVNFLKANEKLLSERKVWLFASGPSGKGDPAQLLKGVIVPNGLKPVIDRIKPQNVAAFHGKLDPEKLKFMEKWIIKNVKAEMGDFRDWDMITKWAKGIAAALKR